MKDSPTYWIVAIVCNVNIKYEDKMYVPISIKYYKLTILINIVHKILNT